MAKASGIQRLISWLRHIGVRIPTGRSRFSFKRAQQWIDQIEAKAHQELAKQKLGFIRYHHQQSLDIFADIRRQGKGYWEIAEFEKIPGIGQGGSHLFSAILEDPHRFQKRSQLYKFCQLAVTSSSSSGSQSAPSGWTNADTPSSRR